MPGLDSSPTPIDLSRLNARPGGTDGFIRADKGHLVDGQGRRVRFFATNLTATACFPEKKDTPRIAARLSKLGFNLVRLHFMDIDAPNGLFQGDMKTIDPVQLDKMDFLVAELKKAGIYINLNLHVARRYPGLTGEAAKRFGMSKLLDRFYPPFVKMHREYAREMLTHVNPYTKLAYNREPAVMCVEINNENTLLPFWSGAPRDLPEPYNTELVRQWNAWLKGKYGTATALRKAWAEGESAGGPNMLKVPATENWDAQTANGSESRLTLAKASPDAGKDAPAAGSPILKWEATKPGTESWNLQLFQTGLAIEAGQNYTVTYRARADREIDLDVTAMLGESPWNNLGLSTNTGLTTEWHLFTHTFRGMASGGRGRLNFSTNNRPVAIELGDVSLTVSPRAGLPAGADPAKGDVPLKAAGVTPPAALDHWRFLIETERGVTAGLAGYIRKDLQVKSLVYDTQASYGEVAGVERENDLSDLVDMHGYWEHPSSWNDDWTIRNISQITADWGGTLGDIAVHRVAGKPFTVSEYNVPTPNDHAAETLPMLAAFGCFQDWDAIYPYTYLDFKREWEADRIVGFFDFAGHPGKLAFAPAAALAFRQGLVAPGTKPVILTIPAGRAPESWAAGKQSVGDMWKKAGVPVSSSALRRLEVRFAQGAGEPFATEKVEPGPVRKSDTGEIAWTPAGDFSFAVNTPAWRMLAGRVSGRTVELGDLSVEFGKMAFNYACLAVTSLDEKPVAESKKVLVTLASRVENQGMNWNADRSSVGRGWGHGPTIAEFVPVTISLPGSGWKISVLDGAGAPKASLKSIPDGTRTRFSTDPANPSLWFLCTR
jgi:hypothetical protein